MGLVVGWFTTRSHSKRGQTGGSLIYRLALGHAFPGQVALFKGPPCISLIYRAGESRPKLFKIPLGKYNRNQEGLRVCVCRKGGRRMEDRNEEVGDAEAEMVGKKQASNYELLPH